ncbi:MAG: NADPH-dependent 7-cyano-7-deazaguanine reductase QueF, partial [Deltaproteobacteria bacterium]
MVEAEGKKLDFLPESAIESEVLETFPYEGVKQLIHYRTEEFSAVCPFSGLPDIARVDIHYIPKDRCLELKSLKYYFVSYRNVGIYQEHAT